MAWAVRHDKCFALQGSCHGSSICCHGRPPSFSIGCASASVTSATTRARCLRTPSTSARRGRGPPSKSAWEASPRSPSLKCRGVACPTPSGFPSLQQQHGSPLHQLVEHLQHHARSRRGRRWRPVSLLHSRRRSVAPGSTTRNQRYFSKRTHSRHSDAAGFTRGPDLHQTPSGPWSGAWSVAGAPPPL